FNNPEVAYAIIYPWATTNFNIYYPQGNETAREILEAYFALKKEYSSTGKLDSSTEQKIIKDYSKEILSENEASTTVQDEQTTAQ
ncbi:MAG: penicillin-binding protein, partial [Lysinibacillus sp.]